MVKARKRKHEALALEDNTAEKNIIKMKKVLKMEKKKKKLADAEEHGDSGVDVNKDSSDSDKEVGETAQRVSFW